MNNTNEIALRTTALSLDGPARPSAPQRSGIALWRPEIVRPDLVLVPARPRVIIADPGQRPEAVAAQVEAARTALDRFAEVHAWFAAQADALGYPARAAGTERERVAAVIETYRMKNALDETLREAVRHVDALMEDRRIR